ATDPELDGLTWTQDSGPGAVDAAGNYSWVTTEANGGATYTVVLRVTDDGIPIRFDTVSFDVIVAEVNQPPAITSPGDQESIAGDAVSVSVAASDPDQPAGVLVFSAAGLPPGINVDGITGVISGTVDGAAVGLSLYSVTLRVTDQGSLFDEVTFLWTVKPALNAPPTAVADSYSVEAGSSLSIGSPGLLANDTDPDGDTLLVSIVSPPTAGTVELLGAGGFIYRHDGSPGTADSFRYRIEDGRGGGSEAIVSIEIIPNAPPIANTDSFVTDEDTSLTLDPLANDVDPDGDSIALDSFGEPEHGTLALVPGGSLRYVPQADFFGSEVITYTIVDSRGGTATGSIRIVVSPVNDIPVGLVDRVTLGSLKSLVIDVLANDYDVDNDVLTLVEILGSITGWAKVNEDGTLTYYPNGEFSGVESFSYVLSDSSGARTTVTVTVEIPPSVVSEGVALADSVGSLGLAFRAPPSDVTVGGASLSLPSGVRLLSNAFYQTLGALQLPLLFLGIGVLGFALVGGVTGAPILLGSKRSRFWAVALMDRELTMKVHAKPHVEADTVYQFEPTASSIKSVGRSVTHNGTEWLPVLTPGGEGWVDATFLTESVPLSDFQSDRAPVQLVQSLARRLERGGDVASLISPRGLAISLSGRPLLIDHDRLRLMLEGSDHALDGAADDLHNSVLAPLLATLKEAQIDPKAKHIRSALIPVELWNFRYLAIQAPGQQSWLVYFDYRHGSPYIVGIGLDE
ncbi:MAG: Ig-like domain-containing protein, partial [Acidimicrobiia bacterium]|nr:Ig-like domain-containing protein [Acidimicrobiia bacterium]